MTRDPDPPFQTLFESKTKINCRFLATSNKGSTCAEKKAALKIIIQDTKRNILGQHSVNENIFIMQYMCKLI